MKPEKAKDIFNRGVEYATKWNKFEEKKPPMDVWLVLAKITEWDKTEYFGAMQFTILNRGGDIEFAKRNFTHWRRVTPKIKKTMK